MAIPGSLPVEARDCATHHEEGGGGTDWEVEGAVDSAEELWEGGEQGEARYMH